MSRTRYGLGGLVVLLVVASAAGQPRTIKLEGLAQTLGAGLYKNSWALVIGINAYKGRPLNYAVADARAVAAALPALGFPAQNVRLLLDGDATKARIETVLYGDLAKKIGPEDRLLLYFAGHGESLPVRGG